MHAGKVKNHIEVMFHVELFHVEHAGMLRLLANAERGKDLAQQVFGADLTSNLPQCGLSETKFFRQKHQIVSLGCGIYMH